MAQEEARESLFDPEAMAARARAATQASETFRNETAHEANVRYGEDAGQVLDLYLPQGADRAPVLVFLHGGAFRGGMPSMVGHYGKPYVKAGVLYAALGYRLIPDVAFPDSCDDVEAGLEWLFKNVEERGGDPDRVVLSGHSAGAMLAAQVGLRPRAGIGSRLKGLVLISGMYDFTKQAPDIMNPASPRWVPNLCEAIEWVPPSVIVVSGDDDLPPVLPDAHAMVDAIEDFGGSAELFIEPNANHFEAYRSFAADGGDVFAATMKVLSSD
ncbi:MAG: alpha/beta hydrolase [Acidimicrobiales bacterium]